MILTVRIERARGLTLRSAGNLSIACAVDQATITTTIIIISIRMVTARCCLANSSDLDV